MKWYLVEYNGRVLFGFGCCREIVVIAMVDQPNANRTNRRVCCFSGILAGEDD